MKLWEVFQAGLLFSTVSGSVATPFQNGGNAGKYMKNVSNGRTSGKRMNGNTPIAAGVDRRPKHIVYSPTYTSIVTVFGGPLSDTASPSSGTPTTAETESITSTSATTDRPEEPISSPIVASTPIPDGKGKGEAPGGTGNDSEGSIPSMLMGGDGKSVSSSSGAGSTQKSTQTPALKSDEAQPTLTPKEALQPAEPGNVTVIDGKEAIEITDIVENMYNDTRLFHRLAESDVDAVDICKSYAFDPSQINWHIAGTHEWLIEYTLANQDRDYFRANGLIQTIAFDFMGMNSFKCAVGTSHLCRIDCPTVVKAIEDLSTARNVFFTLTSATHMLTITEIVHNAMESAQSNLGSMIGKMSFDAFYTTPTKGEQERAKAWQFFIQLSIWAAQSAIGSIIPMIPWAHMQDYIIYQASRFAQREFDSTGRMDHFPKFDFDQWRLGTIENALGEMMTIENGDDGPGSWLVPPKYGGHYKYNPSGTTLGDWWNVNGGAARKWNRWVYGHSNLPIDPEDISNREGWQGTWNALFPDFRRRMQSKGVAHAADHAWTDLKELCSGTAQQWKGKWWWVKNSASDLAYNGGKRPPGAPRSYLDELRRTPAVSRLNPGEKIASWGPVENWDLNERWRYEYGPSTQELLLDVMSRGFASNGDFKKYPIAPFGFRNMTKKLDGARKAINTMVPVGVNLAMPMYLRDCFESCTHPGSDMPHDRNVAYVTWLVQETGRLARRMLKENINRIFATAEVAEDGSTHLSNALAMGSFLPADRGSLHQWTDSSIEDALTKNMYFKTLNTIMKSQKHFISCTPHLLKKVEKHMIVDPKATTVSTCLADNTGPQHLRACVPASSTVEKELVCYLYRWADRGMAPAHHLEEPWGWEKLASFDTSPEDIIKSSLLTHRHTPENSPNDLSCVHSLAWGPTAEFITDPTTPGMFSIPVCNTPYNWNGPTNGYTYSDDVNLWSSRKSLPCYCGSFGNETQQVWAAMRLDTAAKRRDYMTMLCPRQIDNKIKNPLEKYLAMCGLNIKRKAGLNFMKTDHLCEVLLEELESRGISKIDQVSKELTKVLMCKVHQKMDKKCKKYRNTPISDAWREAEELGVTKTPEDGEAETGGMGGGDSVYTEVEETDNTDTPGLTVEESGDAVVVEVQEPAPHDIDLLTLSELPTEPPRPTKTAIDYKALIKPHPRGGKPLPKKQTPSPSASSDAERRKSTPAPTTSTASLTKQEGRTSAATAAAIATFTTTPLMKKGKRDVSISTTFTTTPLTKGEVVLTTFLTTSPSA